MVRVRDFMKYWHPQVPRQLPEPARIEYNALHAEIDNALTDAPAPKKKAARKKKVSKKK